VFNSTVNVKSSTTVKPERVLPASVGGSTAATVVSVAEATVVSVAEATVVSVAEATVVSVASSLLEQADATSANATTRTAIATVRLCLSLFKVFSLS
jgi:hypothetical protein